MIWRAATFALLLAASNLASGQTTVTIAGTGTAGFSGDGGPGTQAQINNPYGLTTVPDGALYFCEIGNHRIRRLDLETNRITTVAGTGQKGHAGDGGSALDASLNETYEVRFDRNGNMFFAEMQNHVVRRVDAKSRIITTVAGTGTAGFAGDGGPAAKAQLRQPHSIAFDAEGWLLATSGTTASVWWIFRRERSKPGPVRGSASPLRTARRLPGTHSTGRAITADPDGNLYLVLREGNAVYRMDPHDGRIYHVAGTGESGYSGDGGSAKLARLSGPNAIAWAPGASLYLADTESHTIRRVDLKSGIIATMVGTGQRGDGPYGEARQCRLARPPGIFVSPGGVIYIADSESYRIRTLR